ncbi:hypothetical protein HYZ05_03145 [Candidatus Daviesbacteria bacterium]|nr:hypothetical protein [Candidatus Daviesbacteria bacterium]
MKKLAVFLFFLLISFLNPKLLFAQSPQSFVSVVNPVRGEDFWSLENQTVVTAVKGQAEILREADIPATWLIRFDALDKKEIIDVLSKLLSHEKGLFLEVTPTWAKAAGVAYRASQNWHDAGSAFLTGYERGEREKLIDAAFDRFKEVFGSYPVSVGAWWIDSYSLDYMQAKYGITAALIVSDQYTTDNYQIWGQYFGVPYYPSRKNVLHPAQSQDEKLPVVVMQWAARDPFNGYGDGVEESTYSVQANDYLDYHKLDTNYFSSLIDIYTKQPFNKFGHIVVGLENSYSWDKYGQEYRRQIEVLADKARQGQFQIVSMKGFTVWYQKSFPDFSSEHLIMADDPLGSFKKAVWFMNPFFRAGFFINQDGAVFRDIRQYVEGEEEICFQKRCDSVNFATFSTRVLDEVTYGQKWVIDEGKISDFKVSKSGEKFIIDYLNEAGKKRIIEFLPRDISVDGKISSIDGVILDATKHTLTQKEKQPFLQSGPFQWSLASIFSKTGAFLVFLLIGCIVPGLVLINKILQDSSFYQKVTLSTILGFVLLTLLFYSLGLFKLQKLVFIYLLINAFLLAKNYKLFAKLKLKPNWGVLGIIFAGVVFQQLPTFKNGLSFPYGLGFWGPNTHDGLWHVSLINQLVKSVPPNNPIFAQDLLKNYHYFYDLLVAVTHYVSGIPILDLLFRFYPVIFSVLLGTGSYFLIQSLTKQKLAQFFGLYLVYFAGSFGWIVEYIKFKHLGGESAFWANQSISFNLNPPFAISMLLIIAIFQLLPNVKFRWFSISVLTVLAGSLLAFKAYAGILILTTLFIVGVLKRSLLYLAVFLTSSILSLMLFLTNFTIGQKLLIFSPFWFIHSMIDSPDRVGWARLSLARVAGAEGGNWFKFAAAESISFLIFLIGNLGTRAFALLALPKITHIVRREDYLSLLIFSSLAFILPVFFIQAGNPWNTIQFTYYFLYISALIGGLVFARIALILPKILALPLVAIFIVITPINSWATANGYLTNLPHAFVGQEEFEALEFLRAQNEGIILTYPYDPKLKNKILEPWPLFVYDSTAYVSALANKAVYLEDEGQNQILLTDYKKRLVAAKDFFVRPDTEFLKNNNISYIYLPKIADIKLDEDSLSVVKIFENDEALIYEVNR